MKGLIYKDLCVIMHSMKRVLIIAPILFFTVMAVIRFGPGMETPTFGLPVVLCMCSGIGIMFAPSSQDEKSGWYKQGFMMPVNRLKFYHARILVHLICLCCSAVLGIVISMFSALICGQFCTEVLGWIFLPAAIMLLFAVIIGISCNALIIRLGVQKTLALVMLFIMLVSIGGSGLLIVSLIQDLRIMSTNFNFISGIILLCVLIIGMTVLLYFLGRRWIMRKEV